MARGKVTRHNHSKKKQNSNKRNQKPSKHNNSNKNPRQKRKYSIHSKDNQERDRNVKRQKTFKSEKPIPVKKVVYPSSESESDEGHEDPMKLLLSTFDPNLVKKSNVAIDSDDSEESDQSEEDTVEKPKESIEQIEDDGNESDVSEKLDDNEIQDADIIDDKDPFISHLFYDLSEQLLEHLQSPETPEETEVTWPVLGNLTISIPKCEEKKTEKKSEFSITEQKTYAPIGKPPQRLNKHVNLADVHIKSQIHKNVVPANKALADGELGPFTALQSELFSIINNYQDLLYNERTLNNGEEIRFIYSLHAVNHVLKTRMKILHHNARLSKKDEVPDEFRDQGLVRPKVLIIVPFKDSCLKIVEMLIKILVPEEKGLVANKLRFMEDFTGGELHFPKKNPKPSDYEKLFTGNIDDSFRIGIQVTKKSLKLYSDFYSSDIIIASPLGLRLIIGAEGEEKRDYDFLASIEVLIMDQTELFYMQNWDHLLHVLGHLHMQPKKSHGTDFSRIRSWALNGWSKYYRQSLIFSSVPMAEINSIFNKRCFNYAGSVRILNPVLNGAIVNVRALVPQVFRKFETDGVVASLKGRFDFFVNKVLPQYKDSIMKQCLIYVPSYFDYVRVRNYFKREDINFVQICEYSKDGKIARARDMFFHGDAHFMLYSERFHHFRRVRVKGIRHIIFYEPPIFPHFYSEMCNLMQETYQNSKSGSSSNMTVTVIYSKYDILQLSGILGTERLQRLFTSEKNFHMFTSSDK